MFDHSTIRPDFRVLASDGIQIGVVDDVRTDDSLQLRLPVGVNTGAQDLIPLSWVVDVEHDVVRLNRTEGDARGIMNHEIPVDSPE